jgi:hypothetical protein
MCRTLLVSALVMLGAPPAHGYPVGAAVPLDEMAKQADLVAKATVVSERVVADPWFDAVPGFEVREAELHIVSIVKGTAASTVRFRHYAIVPDIAMAYAPQHYELDVGATYIVFAMRERGETYRQWQKSHTVKGDEGLFRCATAKPHRGKTVHDAVWAELADLLASTVTTDVIHGIEQLDTMSGGHQIALHDFDRQVVLTTLRPLLGSKQHDVVSAALAVFGEDTPYLDDGQAVFWLVGVGKGEIPGFGALQVTGAPAAAIATTELVALADAGPADLRARAIRVLGRTRTVAVSKLESWSRDADAGVRAAATVTSAERTDRTLVIRGVVDPSPDVRRAAVLAIGYAQDVSQIALLDQRLDDPSRSVRSTAALVLLSLAPAATENVMKARLQSEFRSVFVNALARRDSAPYLAELAEIIESNLQPPEFWGGAIPAGVSWRLLFDYVKSRPASELTAGKLDASLHALEHMRWFSSSEPRDLYALYLLRGLDARAKRFRTDAKRTIPFDMTPSFDQADKSPATFVP